MEEKSTVNGAEELAARRKLQRIKVNSMEYKG